MSYLNRVHDAESSKAFLDSLAKHGLLYHPEEYATESLARRGIGKAFLMQIENNMSATFKYIDPCEYAVSLINGES